MKKAKAELTAEQRFMLWAWFALMAAILIGMPAAEYATSRDTAVVTVTDLRNVPRYCRRSLPLPFRSSVPDLPMRSRRNYCGSVMTDHGDFALPQTVSLLPFAMSRASIVDLLRVGCRYEVRFHGWGPPPRPGSPPSYFPPQTIHHVKPMGQCPPRPNPE